MDITRLAIEKDRITAVAILGILVAGLIAYATMSRAEDPGFTTRWANVVTVFPGASPERVETLITDRLEVSIQEIPELDYVSSVSKEGISVINVFIRDEFSDMRPIWDDLRRKVDRAATDLPDGVIGPNVEDELGDIFGTVVTVTGEGYTAAELKTVADELRDELLLLELVAKVDLFGAQEERIFVEYDNAELAELGLSPVQMQQILASVNIIIPGGSVSTGVERIVLEPSGNFESLADLGRTVVTLPGRQEILHLEDLADISRGYVDPVQSRVSASGDPAIALAVSMRAGSNIIELGEDVVALLDRIRNTYPLGVEFDFVAFAPELVANKVNQFMANLAQAIGIVLFVMLLFLGIRTGFIVASLVPMSMVMALMLMSFMGIGLDQVSLAALIIALGLLVDNAIVMAESIMVQMRAGKSRLKAAVDSAAELRAGLLISSLTTAAAFLPIYLAESATGEYASSLFVVVTITLLSSWLLSLTLTPLLCARFLQVDSTGGDPYSSTFYVLFRRLLLTILRKPLVGLGVVVASFFLALQGFTRVPVEFFPKDDKPIFVADFEFPLGSSIERSERAIAEIEDFMRRELTVGREDAAGFGGEGITNWATFIGEAGPHFMLAYSPKPPGPNYSFALINATSQKVVTDELIPRLEAFCLERFPDMNVTLDLLPQGPPVAAPVQVRVSGRDPDTLFGLVDSVVAHMESIPGTKNVQNDWGSMTKKLVVEVNQPGALRAGVTSQDVAMSLQTALSGFEATQYREGSELIPVTLRSSLSNRMDVSKLTSLNVYSQGTGRAVPLVQVANVNIAWESSQILRRNRMKTVTVDSQIETGVSANAVVQQIRPWLDEQQDTWDIGYRYEFGGEEESSVAANASIGEKFPIAALLIVLLLVIQFNSLRRTLIILVTIPLGLIGVVFGLLITQTPFGFFGLLGVVSLAGMVINDGIALIERIKFEIEENGLEPARAVLDATQRRFRPILLTTATTIAGLIPLWVGGGPMWEPMAVTMIFGMAFATVLTLGVIPVLYSLMFRVNFSQFSD